MGAAILILAAYVIGSTPFGFVAGKLKGKDIRNHGSGNIGATNALRVLGKGIGYTVFLMDFLKGLLPVLGAKALVGKEIFGSVVPDWLPIAVALATILGHNFTFWLGFKGGKGIATSGGTMLGLMWLAVVIALVVWMLVYFPTRYVALASLGAAVSMPVTVAFSEGVKGPLFWFAVALMVLAFVRHRSNIARLLAGTELKMGSKEEVEDRKA